MKRTTLVALIILLIATNAIWLYLSVDRELLLADMSSEVSRQEHSADVLRVLLLDLQCHNGDIEQTAASIKASHPDMVVKRDGNRLEVDEIVLEFKENAIVRVSTF